MTDGIFTVRQKMEKCREKQQTLHMCFIDLEKAYVGILRDGMWRGLREQNFPEKYVRIIQETSMDMTTRVRSTVGVTDSFKVQVGLHQGSALRPLLFNIVFDVLMEAVRENPLWCILYADNAVILAKSKNALQAKLERWRETLESRGLKISRSKVEYMTTDLDGDQDVMIQIGGRLLQRVTSFRYLGSVTQA